MRVDLLATGFALLALAESLWILANLQYGLPWYDSLGFLVAALGWLFALARRAQPQSCALGIALAFLGTLPFFLDQFLPLSFSRFLVAILLYLGGVAALGIGFLLSGAGGQRAAKMAGGLAITVAALIWVQADRSSAWWEPGDLSALAGGLLLLAHAARR